MNDLLRELEALRLTGDFSEESSWSICTSFIGKTHVPEKTIGASRPCEERDYREYRQIVDRNLRNIRSMLQHIIQGRSIGNVDVELCTEAVKSFTVSLLILVGEQCEKNVWNTAESVSISKELISAILELYRCQNVSQLLMKQDIFVTTLLSLRPKLMTDTWKNYPAAVACYKWLLHVIEKPNLYHHINEVLPTALMIIRDYVPENVVIGLECLYQIVQHSYLKEGLITSGRAHVILSFLQPLSLEREPKYITLTYACIANLLDTLEYWDKSLNVFDWTKRDEELETLLSNMEFEQNVELRHAYMVSLPQLLSNIGCGKWYKRLTRIISEYCEHHTNLRTLKATLETAKTFLLLFHLHVTAHCVPLYTAFLRLHYDLTKTPVLDKEIMQNLEDCICLLYKLSPNVGHTVLNDDRMQSVIRNSLQVVCLKDTKYFQ